MKNILLYTGALFLLACNKHEEININHTTEAIEATKSNILINEISGHSSMDNEFGDRADWIELYNKSDKAIILKEGHWSITDNPAKPEKFILPETKIAANGHVLIWCDKSKKDGKDIHANFKISSKGETISLYYKGEISDEVQFDSTDNIKNSYARVKDGHMEWLPTEMSTPNNTND